MDIAVKKRINEEYVELSNKISGLTKAIAPPTSLNSVDIELLEKQRKPMVAYQDVLWERALRHDINLEEGAYDEVQIPFPPYPYEYSTSKRVVAFLIHEIDGNTLITADGTKTVVTDAYMEKHQPEVGGYHVLYKDGYQSFSPAEAFNESATLIGNPNA